jgi:hypothetical protein
MSRIMEHRRNRRIARVLAAGGIACTVMIVPSATPAHAAGGIIISEVASWASGNSSYAVDWFEVTNTGSTPVDITGWKWDDSSNAFASSVALGGITSIAAGESVVFLESSVPATTIPLFTSAWFGSSVPVGLRVGSYSGSGIGLSTGGDAVNLFNAAGVLQANVSFGASPTVAPFATFDNAAGVDNGAISTVSVAGVNGAFLVSTGTPAIGSPGAIAGSVTPPPTTSGGTTTTTTVATAMPWPGSQTAQAASTFVFGGNMSGLIEETWGSAAPGVLWGVRNGPGALFRLLWNGTNWAPDTANGWSAGKLVRYPNGTGDADSEGVTFAGADSSGGIFIAAERNNLANTVSRLSILRVDPAATGTELTATMEWNLTADLSAVGANLGFEAITWVPDTYLVANNFYDAAALKTYNPADYPDHGTGLFFVGVEGTGQVHGYALNQVSGTFTRIVSFSSSFPGVMELQFDRDLSELWAVCDNTCNGQHALHRISPTTGAFALVAKFERPTGLPNYNNEGFSIAAATQCAAGRKPTYWADDSETLGVAIRAGSISCAAYVVAPPVEIPELPSAVLASTIAAALLGGALLISRRRRPLNA